MIIETSIRITLCVAAISLSAVYGIGYGVRKRHRVTKRQRGCNGQRYHGEYGGRPRGT